MTQQMTAAEKAKYNAWRNKAGIDAETAMRNYIQEAERQVRAYGYAVAIPNQSHSQSQPATTTTPPHPTNRGLAAIPLLCAAASEQREAYLRRIQNTHPNAAWWKRQEPLTATPGSIPAIPETLLLTVASWIEFLSIRVNPNEQFQCPIVITAVLQSYFWPLHNAFLAVWMGWILIASIIAGTYELARTILFGSRRTGRTLSSTWNDEIVFASNSVYTLTESHQPISARVTGLVLQPLPWIVSILQAILGGGGASNSNSNNISNNNNNNNHNNYNPLWMSTTFVIITMGSWWYWCIVLPWFFIVIMLGTSLILGNCFALIELAAHV
jgi:hypothetical protein